LANRRIGDPEGNASPPRSAGAVRTTVGPRFQLRTNLSAVKPETHLPQSWYEQHPRRVRASGVPQRDPLCIEGRSRMSIRFQPGMRALMICRALRGQALGLCAAMLFASACQQAAAPTRGPREVGVVETKQEEIPIFTDFVGTIDGVDNAEIRARVPGYVQEIHYKEGTPIKAGDLLFTLNPVLSQATARQAAGDVAMARAKAMRAKADAERYKELYAKNSATVQEYD